MKVVGFVSGEGYKSIVSDTGEIKRTFNYNEWNNQRNYNISGFTNSLQKEMGTGNIADLMAYNQVAKVQVAAEMPGAKIVGMEDNLSEQRRLSQEEQKGLEPSTKLGPFKLLRYEIVNAGSLNRLDKDGKPKVERLYRLKIEYGYRLIDKKTGYHYKMHELALGLIDSASQRMMHLGNLDRRWFNDRIYANDFQMELLSPYRWGADYDYRKTDLRDDSVKYRKGPGTKLLNALWGVPGGLILGPRISVISTKPMTKDRIEDLETILRETAPLKRAEDMQNN